MGGGGKLPPPPILDKITYKKTNFQLLFFLKVLDADMINSEI